MIIFIFGDSITQGYWDEKGGWADRLKAAVLERDVHDDFRYYHGVHNLGVDGNTTTQVVERFGSETAARFWPGSHYGVIFAVGTNDTVTHTDNSALSTPEQYKESLAKLLNKARSFTENIAFVNLTPVDEALTNPLPSSSTGKCYTNQRIDLFNKALADFCHQNNATLIDVHSLYDKPGLLADGLHPNTAGHEVIYHAVKEQADTWLYVSA